MQRRLPFIVALLGVLAIGSFLLFFRLGAAPWELYDEGLYGMYARNALHYDRWLHAVDIQGSFPSRVAKFSKPPLALWLVAGSIHHLGPSLFALRLPFALASLAIALLSFVWGTQIQQGTRGIRLGFIWALLWLTCHGTYHYGRTATIEPLLIAFVMLAIFAHARAMRGGDRAALGWAAVSGLAITGAFFTKQLVCALAVIPIAALELRRLRDGATRAWFARFTLALGLPALAALGWGYSVWSKVGSDAASVLWQHAVVNRMGGYDGLQHRNHVSRVAEQLDLDAVPFAWELGALGLVLCLVSNLRERRPARDDVWLLGGFLLCAWLAFDVASQSILPWYVMTLIPALAFGNAWLVTFALAAFEDGWPSGRLGNVVVGAGCAAIVLVGAHAARGWAPALMAAVLISAAVAWLSQASKTTHGQANLVFASLTAVILVGALGRANYSANEPDPLSTLGSALWKHGAKHVSLDDRVKTHGYTRVTFFGTLAESTRAPWKLGRPQAEKFDARVELASFPTELKPRRGLGLLRAAGAYAIWGDMTQPPFTPDDLKRALAKAPLTFEAEHMATDRYDTRADDGRASGGAVRRMERGLRARTDKALLVKGPTIELPAGKYKVTFWLATECTGFSGEVLGELSVSTGFSGAQKRRLNCHDKRAPGGPYFSLEISLTLATPSPLHVALTHKQGSIALDKMTVARADTRP